MPISLHRVGWASFGICALSLYLSVRIPLQVEDVAELAHPSPVVKVGWHPTRGWLAVSLRASLLHLWRANLAGDWTLIRRLVGTPEPES